MLIAELKLAPGDDTETTNFPSIYYSDLFATRKLFGGSITNNY